MRHPPLAAPQYDNLMTEADLESLIKQCDQSSQLRANGRVTWFWQLDPFNFVPFSTEESAMLEAKNKVFEHRQHFKFLHAKETVTTAFGEMVIDFNKRRILGPPKMFVLVERLPPYH